MRRDLLNVLSVLLISSGAAVAANVGWYKMDWLRKPVGQAAPLPHSDAGQTAADASAAFAKPGFASAEQVLKHLAEGTAYFIDARERNEYSQGHVRRAIHVPSSAIYENMDVVAAVIPLDDLVIVYCGGGQCEASHNVADALRRDFGYTNVLIHERGWEDVTAMYDRFAPYIVTGEES